MAAQRTVSTGLNIEQAAETRAALEQLGSTGGGALDKLRSGIERLGAADTSSVVAALERITTAAKRTQEATAQAQAAAFAGIKAPTGADDYSKRAADVQAYGAQLDALPGQIQPAIRCQQTV